MTFLCLLCSFKNFWFDECLSDALLSAYWCCSAIEAFLMSFFWSLGGMTFYSSWLLSTLGGLRSMRSCFSFLSFLPWSFLVCTGGGLFCFRVYLALDFFDIDSFCCQASSFSRWSSLCYSSWSLFYWTNSSCFFLASTLLARSASFSSLDRGALISTLPSVIPFSVTSLTSFLTVIWGYFEAWWSRATGTDWDFYLLHPLK